MKLLITIDVEEDNWGDYRPAAISIENLKRIPALQDLFDEFGIKPTYLITYPVATDPYAIAQFSAYLKQGKCEIGMHCHPWNTPPHEEEICDRNSMLCNLPEALVHRKLSTLHAVICENYKVAPVSFRSGRWGFGPAVARSLCRLGYRIDSSVASFINWGVFLGPDYSKIGPEPSRLSALGSDYKGEVGNLLQLPATVGFLQPNFARCQRLVSMFDARVIRRLHINGVLMRLGLLNKVWLSPEKSEARDMIRLSRRMIKEGYRFINLSFHSTSLQAGLSPFVKTLKDEREFLTKIRTFLAFIRSAGIQNCTLQDVASHELREGNASLTTAKNLLFVKRETP